MSATNSGTPSRMSRNGHNNCRTTLRPRRAQTQPCTTDGMCMLDNSAALQQIAGSNLYNQRSSSQHRHSRLNFAEMTKIHILKIWMLLLACKILFKHLCSPGFRQILRKPPCTHSCQSIQSMRSHQSPCRATTHMAFYRKPLHALSGGGDGPRDAGHAHAWLYGDEIDRLIMQRVTPFITHRQEACIFNSTPQIEDDFAAATHQLQQPRGCHDSDYQHLSSTAIANKAALHAIFKQGWPLNFFQPLS